MEKCFDENHDVVKWLNYLGNEVANAPIHLVSFFATREVFAFRRVSVDQVRIGGRSFRFPAEDEALRAFAFVIIVRRSSRTSGDGLDRASSGHP